MSNGAASSLSMPLVIDASRHGRERHHSHHSHSGESGGKTPSSNAFCGADAKVACVALTGVACVALVVSAANVLLFVRRARLVRRGENLEPASPRAAGNMRERLLSNSTPASTARGATPATLAAAVAAALAVSHLVSASSSSSSVSPDSEFYHFCLATTWSTAASLCGVAASCRRAPRVRPVAWLVPLLYLVEVVVVLSSQAAPRPPPSPSPSSSPRLPLYAALARLSVALALAVSQARRGLSSVDLEEDALVTRALLAGPAASSSSSSSSSLSSRTDVERPAGPFSVPKGPSRSWMSLLGVAIAFVWPEEPGHQARAAACVVLLVLSRVANLAVPASYAYLVNRLAAADASAHPPTGSGQAPAPTPLRSLLVPAVAAYLAALYLQGGSGGGSMGLLNNARQFAWIPISQAAARKINVDAFAHVLGMDLRYHLMRKTGELTRVLDRGSSAIQNLLSTVLFQVGPQLFDIAAAAVYVAAALEPWVAAIMFVTLASYIPLTIFLTERRGKYRKELNARDNVRSARATDALLSWETVSYFGAQEREVARLAGAIDEYQRVEMKLLASLNSLNVIQSTVIFAGTASGLYVCSVGVANGSLRVGDAVLFLSLMAQLAIPLNWFGTFYRTVMQQMLDADGLFSLLAQVPTVVDAPDAVDLPPGGDGSLEFRNVTFSWESRASCAAGAVPRSVGPAPAAAPSSSSSSPASSPVLKDVSLRAPGGTSLAIVGPTGSGKSTLLRLAFRFVDPDAGAVLVEGRDARSLRQRSLRSIMSVTPQDSVLFNDTIEYNLRYANPGASFEEVEAAARVAAIHDSILTFPKGYQTVVGERGLRLSGGEKQRVALARAVLRRARIMLLDESTSALDALTEAAVQRALRGAFSSASASAAAEGGASDGGGADGGGKRAKQRPPTMLIVAHRLSTVMHCDSIAVMKEGRVVEVGKHSELVSLGGLYANMWARQSSSAAALVEGEDEGGEEEGKGGEEKKDT